MPIEQQVVIIWAATNGFVDDLPVEAIKKFEAGLIDFLENTRGSLLQEIAEKKNLDDSLKDQMKAAVSEFKDRFTAEGEAGYSGGSRAAQPVASAR
jgi:F-type H+-transporting ATPase subunit alpha